MRDAIRTTGWLDRLYRRTQRWYILVCALYILGVAVLAAATTAYLVSQLIPHKGSDVLRFVVGAELCIVVALPIALIHFRHEVRNIWRYLRSRGATFEPEEMWRACISFGYRAGPVAFVTVGLLAPFVAVYIVVHRHIPLPTLAPLIVVTDIGVATTAIYIAYSAQTLVRPIMRELRWSAPGELGIDLRLRRFRVRTVLAFGVTTVFSTLAAYAIHPVTPLGPSRILSTIGLSVAIGITFTALLSAAVADSVCSPLDDLLAGTRRVVQRDLVTPVPITSVDELGDLAASFNEMLLGLQDREALRARSDSLGASLRATLADVRSSQARLLSVADSERQRMERDLHDGAQQSLIFLRLKLGQLIQALPHDRSRSSGLIAELQNDAQHALDQLRDLAHGIYPAALATDGLPGALEELAARTEVPVGVACSGVDRLPPEVEVAIYFCCVEAVSYSAKHASPGGQVRIQLAEESGVLSFRVTHWGADHFDPGEHPESSLQIMADRIGALGGWLDAFTAPDGATRVVGSVPVEAEPGSYGQSMQRPA